MPRSIAALTYQIPASRVAWRGAGFPSRCTEQQHLRGVGKTSLFELSLSVYQTLFCAPRKPWDSITDALWALRQCNVPLTALIMTKIFPWIILSYLRQFKLIKEIILNWFFRGTLSKKCYLGGVKNNFTLKEIS